MHRNALHIRKMNSYRINLMKKVSFITFTFCVLSKHVHIWKIMNINFLQILKNRCVINFFLHKHTILEAFQCSWLSVDKKELEFSQCPTLGYANYEERFQTKWEEKLNKYILWMSQLTGNHLNTLVFETKDIRRFMHWLISTVILLDKIFFDINCVYF